MTGLGLQMTPVSSTAVRESPLTLPPELLGKDEIRKVPDKFGSTRHLRRTTRPQMALQNLKMEVMPRDGWCWHKRAVDVLGRPFSVTLQGRSRCPGNPGQPRGGSQVSPLVTQHLSPLGNVGNMWGQRGAKRKELLKLVSEHNKANICVVTIES